MTVKIISINCLFSYSHLYSVRVLLHAVYIFLCWLLLCHVCSFQTFVSRLEGHQQAGHSFLVQGKYMLAGTQLDDVWCDIYKGEIDYRGDIDRLRSKSYYKINVHLFVLLSSTVSNVHLFILTSAISYIHLFVLYHQLSVMSICLHSNVSCQ